ncbi:MAG: YceI family protein [Balneolaceae bacterium]
MNRILITLTIFLTFSVTTLFAQNYSIVTNNSDVTITGTSNVHDWESSADEFSGSATIELEDDSLVSISALEFVVLVDGIKSGKGGMDDKTYDALNKKKYPNIKFILTDIAEIKDTTLIANGKLTIAGVTKTIQMEVNYEVLPNGTVSFKGTEPIKMTDYKVDPPKAMFGAIKAGDNVEVTFDAKFIQQQASISNQ